ncbi:nitroreductase family deazaflavin-dependent oxidoreductase [Mycolicibacterium neworleansense]|uniref:Deazaflavin-dependent nitroreductase family protein n=1 Tax=Mycolicibacterium neworleansense TaxID=146018 RepID=A0A0H5RRE0_9MYCO|nr:nitroreductase family deazaflavin-dependent oxidoreductase [Mycolicibacterium neworleansense]MCV7361380.1 nitroreductase family deazaflavin-dependent oxidoreductase [Mycolicibacterium neworleansense]CRZ16730.1 deazaflavin-dependent nitroreductase family protein [Mycolicibacterium neworleansense]
MRLARAVAGSRLPYRLMLRGHRLIPPTERLVRRLSRGRLGVLELAGLPSLQLTVAGRRSGTPRTVTLQYVPDGRSLLLVASNWGLPTHPGWSHNLGATDRALIERDGNLQDVTAEQLSGAERQRAWNVVLDFWPNYALAQERAGDRTFRIFALRPTGDA